MSNLPPALTRAHALDVHYYTDPAWAAREAALVFARYLDLFESLLAA